MSSPVIVALDFDSAGRALALARELAPARCRLKVGKALFTRAGPPLLEKLRALGFEVFLDLKFHDIPSTVAGAVRAAAELGVWMVNVHASGGRRMLESAREAAGKGGRRPLLVGVTVLTSLADPELRALGSRRDVAGQVAALAGLARDSGLDGVVCSALEAPELRRRCGPEFKLVTPGIRPAGEAGDDQRRVATPAAALRMGSDYLVIGRPITGAADPGARLAAILGGLEGK